jgi:hypothetical protein
MREGDELAAWLAARAGKLTASRMRDAMSFRKDGKPSAERSQLMRELLAERITGHSVRHYVTDAMQHGLDTEADALAAYEAATGELVTPAGYYDHPRIDNVGATPDGLLSGDGLIETKCPTTATFIDWTMAGEVPAMHKPQMIIQLACTGRAWCEFVAYDPRIQATPANAACSSGASSRRRTRLPRSRPRRCTFLAELDAMFAAFTAKRRHDEHSRPPEAAGTTTHAPWTWRASASGASW